MDGLLDDLIGERIVDVAGGVLGGEGADLGGGAEVAEEGDDGVGPPPGGIPEVHT